MQRPPASPAPNVREPLAVFPILVALNFGVGFTDWTPQLIEYLKVTGAFDLVPTERMFASLPARDLICRDISCAMERSRLAGATRFLMTQIDAMENGFVLTSTLHRTENGAVVLRKQERMLNMQDETVNQALHAVVPALAGRGSLPREVIRQVVDSHIEEVRACYIPAVERNPDLAGRVVVEISVAPNGQVNDCRVTETTLDERRVEQCIADAVRGWNFPPTRDGGAVLVSYPFILQP